MNSVPADENDDSNSTTSSSASLHTIPDLDIVDINGYEDPSTITPLMHAAKNGDLDGVQKAQRRYNVGSANNQGLTALHFAVLGKHADVVTFLLGHEETNVDARDWTGKTVLMHACHNRIPINIIQSLLESGCDPNLIDNQEMSALWHAFEGEEMVEWENFNPTIIELLTHYGADINAFHDGIKQTPINYVLTCRDEPIPEVVGALLYYGADPSTSLDIIDKITNDNLLEMVLPYFSTCNIKTLARSNLRTFAALWRVQSRCNRVKFAEIIESSGLELLQNLLRTCGSMTCEADIPLNRHTDCCLPNLNKLQQLSTLLYELFDCEEMAFVMYTEEMGKQIQWSIMRLCSRINIPDELAADILRIGLCNNNCIYDEILDYFATNVHYPKETIRVLEDFNPTSTTGTEPLHLIFEKVEEHRSWMMYTRKPAILKRLGKDRYCTFNPPSVRPYFLSVLRGFYSVEGNPSLLELCRDVLREHPSFRRQVHLPRQFGYAVKIKLLPVPKIIHDILLLRSSIYR